MATLDRYRLQYALEELGTEIKGCQVLQLGINESHTQFLVDASSSVIAVDPHEGLLDSLVVDVKSKAKQIFLNPLVITSEDIHDVDVAWVSLDLEWFSDEDVRIMVQNIQDCVERIFFVARVDSHSLDHLNQWYPSCCRSLKQIEHLLSDIGELSSVKYQFLSDEKTHALFMLERADCETFETLADSEALAEALDDVSEWASVSHDIERDIELWRNLLFHGGSTALQEFFHFEVEMLSKALVSMGGNNSLVDLLCGTSEHLMFIRPHWTYYVGIDDRVDLLRFSRRVNHATDSARAFLVHSEPENLLRDLRQELPTSFWTSSRLVACLSNSLTLIPRSRWQVLTRKMVECAGSDGMVIISCWDDYPIAGSLENKQRYGALRIQPNNESSVVNAKDLREAFALCSDVQLTIFRGKRGIFAVASPAKTQTNFEQMLIRDLNAEKVDDFQNEDTWDEEEVDPDMSSSDWYVELHDPTHIQLRQTMTRNSPIP